MRSRLSSLAELVSSAVEIARRVGGEGDAVQSKPQSSFRMVYYQGVSLDALRCRAAKRAAAEHSDGAPPAKAARGAGGRAECASDAHPPVGPREVTSGRVAPREEVWLDCVPEVAEAAEEPEPAGATAAAKVVAPNPDPDPDPDPNPNPDPDPNQVGPKRWSAIALAVHGRSGKQCRLRWCNQIDPDIKHESWTDKEDATLEPEPEPEP